MDFKEKYQSELENIIVSGELNQKILKESNNQVKKASKPLYFRYVAAAIICIATIGIATNFNTISTIAKSIFGTFKIIVGDEEFDFGEMETIEFDFEKFKESGAEKTYGTSSDVLSLYKSYESYDKCIEETNLPITIINNAEIDYVSVDAAISGHSVRTFISGTYDKCNFTMNGRAETTGSTLETWGFGDTEAKVIEVYEYSEGKKAYILNYDTYDSDSKMVQIYFQHNSFLQQLYIEAENEKAAIKVGKELLNNIVE